MIASSEATCSGLLLQAHAQLKRPDNEDSLESTQSSLPGSPRQIERESLALLAPAAAQPSSSLDVASFGPLEASGSFDAFIEGLPLFTFDTQQDAPSSVAAADSIFSLECPPLFGGEMWADMGIQQASASAAPTSQPDQGNLFWL